jgi:His Kinase A (phospho-acceptor) domain
MSSAGSALARRPADSVPCKGRSPLAHLLHALNQPLTGLQCSLELAVGGPRRPEQYVHTLNEALELTARMRILVEAVRELADLEQPDLKLANSAESEPVLLDGLMRAIADDLRPVAETKGVLLSLESETPLPIRADRRRVEAWLFRCLESVLSLAQEGSALRIVAAREHEKNCLVVRWQQGPEPEYSPFSPPELGLLVAQAAAEQAGAEWIIQQQDRSHTCTIRLPMDSPGSLAECVGPEVSR